MYVHLYTRNVAFCVRNWKSGNIYIYISKRAWPKSVEVNNVQGYDEIPTLIANEMEKNVGLSVWYLAIEAADRFSRETNNSARWFSSRYGNVRSGRANETDRKTRRRTIETSRDRAANTLLTVLASVFLAPGLVLSFSWRGAGFSVNRESANGLTFVITIFRTDLPHENG